MNDQTMKIYGLVRTLASFEPTALSLTEGGDLTYEEVRDMLVFVRQLKTKLEVIWAEKENDRG